MKNDTLISHAAAPSTLENTLKQIKSRIISAGDKPHLTVNQQLSLLSELSQFDFGRYLLMNQGVNGFWTHYMLTYPWFGRGKENDDANTPLTAMESFLLNKAPAMLATQQRFEIFLRENQKSVTNKSTLACIPSGMMGELLYLDYANIDTVNLIGIDYDACALKDAKQLAEAQGLTAHVSLIQKDAWDLSIHEAFDLISSNGLNIYSANTETAIALYQQFYNALKFNGKLVTSFLTYPPPFTTQCEWDFSKINPEHLLLQKNIFVDIIETKFNHYSSSTEIRAQLENIGFSDIEFIYDEAKMFATVVAYKRA